MLAAQFRKRVVLANVPSFRFSFRGNTLLETTLLEATLLSIPLSSHWEIKGRFRKRVVLANVPSFRFSFRGNIRQNHPFGKITFCEPPKTWVPKCGSLKSAGKRQESATFLQRSFFDVAVQLFVCCSAAFGQNDVGTAEKRMLQCNFCSAAFRKLQRNFRFRLSHVAGVGFRGVGFRTC